MKKILFLIIGSIIITGCNNPNRDFVKTCEQVTEFAGYKEDIQTKVNFNHNDEVTKVVIKKMYTINDKVTMDSIKKSTESYNNNFQYSSGVSIKSENKKDNNYVVTYTLHPKEMKQIDLEQFNVKKNSVKYFNYLKKNGVKCLKNDWRKK